VIIPLIHTLCALLLTGGLAGCVGEDAATSTGAARQDATSSTAANADSVVVAATSAGPITYRKIRCGAAVPKEQCREVEQENLRVRLSQLIVFAAAETHNVTLTPDELREVEARVAEQRQAIDRAARTFRAAIAGAARVHAGETLEDVAADVAVPVAMIKGAMSEYPTEAEVRAALTRDIAKELQDAARKTYMRAKLTAKLRALVHKQAAEHGVSEADAAETFFNDVARLHQFRVTDSRYQLPDFKEVLNDYEISIQSSPQN
jgi:uncharacterized coiled-coil protein SlyX